MDYVYFHKLARLSWVRFGGLIRTAIIGRLGSQQLFMAPALCHLPIWVAVASCTSAWTLGLTRSRQTRPANCPIDGVGICTILNKSTGPELLLQKQYRPPIDQVVIEVPAGLIDAGETVEQCAVRELKEETGYVGVAVETSPVMFNGKSSELIGR